jgi:ATP-dependent 26S proteasome regulatory subunit
MMAVRRDADMVDMEDLTAAVRKVKNEAVADTRMYT